MKQVLIIHGGTSFSSYDAYRSYLSEKELNIEKLTQPLRWKEHLTTNLPDFQVLYPTMPNSTNAVYEEWVVYFEKLIPLLGNEAQILGHSLGAMFLAKYFHDNRLQTPVEKLILVSGGYNDDSVEDLGSFKVDSATGLELSSRQVHLIHSKDDPIVPYSELAKFQADLPNATTHTFDDRGHFVGDSFPEILDIIQQK